MQIAFYKGSWKIGDILSDPGKFIGHVGICIRTLSKYSHAELVIDGLCWSSSARDGGVREKEIQLEDGHWDVFPVLKEFDNREQALQWFREHNGLKYDFWGIAKFVVPFLRDSANRWFCSEAIAAALGVLKPYKLAPKHLLKFVQRT
jgi:hypothetical protein